MNSNQKFAYGLRHRPPSIGCQPRGDIDREIFDYRQYDERFGTEIWGFVTYDHELTKQEIKDFELTDSIEWTMREEAKNIVNCIDKLHYDREEAFNIFYPELCDDSSSVEVIGIINEVRALIIDTSSQETKDLVLEALECDLDDALIREEKDDPQKAANLNLAYLYCGHALYYDHNDNFYICDLNPELDVYNEEYRVGDGLAPRILRVIPNDQHESIIESFATFEEYAGNRAGLAIGLERGTFPNMLPQSFVEEFKHPKEPFDILGESMSALDNAESIGGISSTTELYKAYNELSRLTGGPCY